MKIIFVGFLIGFFYTFFAFTSVITVTQATIQYGPKNGFCVGLGHAVAQVIWAGLALFLLTLGSKIINADLHQIRIIGAILLLLIALMLYFSKETKNERKDFDLSKAYIKDFLIGFGVAISFPIRILGYLALFTLANSILHSRDASKLLLLSSATLGTVIWWGIYCPLIGKLQISPSQRQLLASRRILALLLILLAAMALFW